MTNETEPAQTYHLTIHDFPVGERPRERLQYYGAKALSNAELLAILLRVGAPGENVVTLSTRLLKDFGGLAGLDKASFTDLQQIRGIDTAKIAQLKAALELGRRLLISSPDARPQITCPADAANLLMLEMGSLEQEHLRTILLDTKNRVLDSPTVYQGNVNSSIIRISEVFRQAITNLNLGQIPEAKEAFQSYLKVDANGPKAAEVEAFLKQLP